VAHEPQEEEVAKREEESAELGLEIQLSEGWW